jgi:hypothetical protein
MLAEAGGLTADERGEDRNGLTSQPPPDWDGEQRGEVGIHGVSRGRRWDTVATATAPGLHGDEVWFVALPDGTLIDESDEAEPNLAALAEAIEATLSPPYRAEGVRRSGDVWAVAAQRIAVVEARGLDGQEAELAVTAGDRSLTVDGQRVLGRVPAFEAAGERLGGEYVVRAKRLDGDLWEVEAAPL